ncbi:Hypothetical_protein [Hexamita inflata]|uniref:Hypothetical_protein n=1 Tax=Hexamita inflata TaxID=28002 RepID=A0AA86RNF9_9EUKA|nr:Hypothetical protein HINF_LOCUS1493 [Hexamita inflata]CAI9913850.1 Hypothetical protein HINF_LOCUS1495 [Hexamita inflata]CAI9923569.1 Hypothetical protein HINF_LOCUS11214 [Hexamita inflata]CAI9930337.1 Hypothetical protein HINF_LOCUS17982 [Hexamita inflata]CAI9930339.1 Hypothetical protein HINF_LOCUS17984 [Hexamita inflata]
MSVYSTPLNDRVITAETDIINIVVSVFSILKCYILIAAEKWAMIYIYSILVKSWCRRRQRVQPMFEVRRHCRCSVLQVLETRNIASQGRIAILHKHTTPQNQQNLH